MTSSVIQKFGARLRFRTAVALTAVVALGALVVTPPVSAAAYSGADFDPGYIISDAQFYAGGAMTEAEIQAFLNMMRPTCLAGYTCLKDYRMTTQTKAPDPMCNGYAGAANELAARIIAKVAQSCSINPKVLLVMLQKEQGLITDDWPTTRQYAAAMGAGCPDTAGCDPAQAGFFQQVYFAAWYLVRYGAPAGTGPGTEYTSTFNAYANWSSYAPGANFAIWYHPNTRIGLCGTRTIYIRNQPTASLYTYTPYTPNAAALANLGGTGDSCSSYGNRNFWDYYTAWFGNPAGLAPTGVDVSRITGTNRFDTSAKLSLAWGTTSAPVVYIANGLNFPDALSAAPAAIMQDAPLLLVTPTSLPPQVRTELERLNPETIYVLGADNSVSGAVFDELATLASVETIRITGIDRYGTSRDVAERFFTPGTTPLAYISTGEGFPDALSASVVAGAQGAPIILVRGSAARLDDATRATLALLGVTSVIVTGGPTTVSVGIENDLRAIPGMTVERITGVNRYQTSNRLVRDVVTSSPTVIVASGVKFPDALAGATLAGHLGAALYITHPSCLYRDTIQGMMDIGMTQMIVLGGPDTVSTNVESFVNCD